MTARCAELRFLYNDAYLPLLGSKHPALGRPGDQVWGEIWDTIGPMLDSVLHTGQATWSEDLLLPMNRHGYWEETYWTYSYSPLHDDDGTVRGVFTAVRDTTEQVVGRRRLAALQDLGAQAGQARSVAEACDLVVRALDRAREVAPFAAIYLRGPDGGRTALIRSTWPGPDPSPLPGGPGGWPVDEVARSGHPVTLTDVIARFGELPAGGWQTPPAEAMVLPLKGGTGDQLTGAIVLAASAGRALDEAYQSFLGLVAQQTAALVNSAVEYQAQLRRAEELAERATVFCGILDPGTGQLTYSSAAHPPGIVVHPDGRIVLLDGGRSLPLAIRQDAARTEAAYALPPLSTLLLYTDGLVERRGRPLTDGIATAGTAVRGASEAPLEDLADQVMTRLAPAGGYEDDVAIVLCHHPAPLEVTFAADSGQLAPVRASLRSWLHSCGIGARTAQDVLVTAGEARANAIEHGHRHSAGRQVRLRAVSTANQLRLTITDTGRWRTSQPGDGPHRGPGIALMRALMNQVTIEPGPAGTTVDMYLRITHGYPA